MSHSPHDKHAHAKHEPAKHESHAKAKAPVARAMKRGEVINTFTLTDDPDKAGSYIVNLTNAAGDVIDASTVATIHVSSADPTLLNPEATGPNTFDAKGLKATASVLVTIVVTANDNNFGPFTKDVAFSVTPGGPTGFTVSQVA